MDPQVQTSFIPKKSLVESRGHGAGVGLLLLLSILLFALSVVGAGAAFAYQGIERGLIANKDTSLKAAEGAFEPNVIEDLIRLDSRLKRTSDLLQKHIAPSGVFDFLSTITLEKVQFTSFGFTAAGGNGGGATINLTGVGDSFSTVALQSDQFGATRLLKDVVFSGVAVGAGGKVSFSVSATLDPSLYIYGRENAATTAVPNPGGASTATTTP